MNYKEIEKQVAQWIKKINIELFYKSVTEGTKEGTKRFFELKKPGRLVFRVRTFLSQLDSIWTLNSISEITPNYHFAVSNYRPEKDSQFPLIAFDLLSLLSLGQLSLAAGYLQYLIGFGITLMVLMRGLACIPG